MAVVARANNGKYYMTYEMVSMPGYALEPRSNPVYFKVSDNGLNWGDPKHPGTLIQDRWRQFPQATPYIVCCDTGRRSAAAAYILVEKGFDAYVLKGGITQAQVPLRRSA